MIMTDYIPLLFKRVYIEKSRDATSVPYSIRACVVFFCAVELEIVNSVPASDRIRHLFLTLVSRFLGDVVTC